MNPIFGSLFINMNDRASHTYLILFSAGYVYANKWLALNGNVSILEIHKRVIYSI